jgi:hypothetical protein
MSRFGHVEYLVRMLKDNIDVPVLKERTNGISMRESSEADSRSWAKFGHVFQFNLIRLIA